MVSFVNEHSEIHLKRKKTLPFGIKSNLFAVEFSKKYFFVVNIAQIAIVSNIIFALCNHQLNFSHSKRKTHQKQKKIYRLKWNVFTYTETDFYSHSFGCNWNIFVYTIYVDFNGNLLIFTIAKRNIIVNRRIFNVETKANLFSMKHNDLLSSCMSLFLCSVIMTENVMATNVWIHSVSFFSFFHRLTFTKRERKYEQAFNRDR